MVDNVGRLNHAYRSTVVMHPNDFHSQEYTPVLALNTSLTIFINPTAFDEFTIIQVGEHSSGIFVSTCCEYYYWPLNKI